MGADLDRALEAAGVDPAAAGLWHELLTAAYVDAAADWAGFCTRFPDLAHGQLDDGQVQALLVYLEQAGGPAAVQQLVTSAATPSGPAFDEQPAAPEPSWDDLIARIGSGWATYSGTDASWIEHRDRMYANANAADPRLYALAYEHFAPLDTLPITDRTATLSRWGLPVAGAHSEPNDELQSESAGHPDDPWTQAVVAFGASWDTLAGTEQSWTEHRDRFYRSTNDADPQLYAIAYAQLSPLETLPVDERANALRQLGITVATPAATGSPNDEHAEIVRLLEEGFLESTQ